ncbi:MAG: hypothetical protein ACRDRL_05215 [Sciscionella sp.]
MVYLGAGVCATATEVACEVPVVAAKDLDGLLGSFARGAQR